MQKKEREITAKKELLRVLKNGRFTTISMCRNNEPYIVTLSYGYDGGKNALYFHAALKGLKLDFIRENPKVCGTVIEDRGYASDECEQHYRSVVYWGKMHVVDKLEEKKHGLDILLNHLETDPEPIKKRNVPMDKDYKKVTILRLDIDEMSGKQAL
jgi:nitroimidazol reductase NimA-like FMN-containing flavoprotein (pyridoxamine 5'-phosphate oxidase superfamily)